MSDLFDPPGSADQLDLESVEGALLLIKPKAHQSVSTAYGDKECVEADVHILDGPKSGSVHRSVFLFPLVLQGQLRRNVGSGRYNLGRLGKRPASRPGQNPAWALQEPNASDEDVARQYLARMGSDSPAPAPAPAGASWDSATPPF